MTTTEIVLDGSTGEGGGQVLRTALTLSLVTGRPFRIAKIRASRSRPGLLRQHLAAVRAAKAAGDAVVEGDVLGSTEVSFTPRALRGGRHEVAIGSAGSATLVLATLLPALLRAGEASEIVIEGGTHNVAAPPWDFVEQVWLPVLRAMGARVSGTLERAGFVPAGGGRVVVRVEPSVLVPIDRTARAGELDVAVVARVAGVSSRVAWTEAKAIAEALELPREATRVEELPAAWGPGNVVFVSIRERGAAEGVACELITGFGEKGVPAEHVARSVIDATRQYLAVDAPVGVHLADQLVLLLALAGGGAMRTPPLDRHTTTQLELIPRFLPVRFGVVEESGGVVRIEVR
ncbi:MAG: RNA 3'-terminal phosphate cyclase [Deltaproteobacteria bacterium]